MAMEDLITARIKRLHGDFLDPDGEYDIVSSLSIGTNNDLHGERQAWEHDNDVEIIRDVSPLPVGLEDGTFPFIGFITVVGWIWMTLTTCVIVWLSWRWMTASSSTKFSWQSKSGEGVTKKGGEDSKSGSKPITKMMTTTNSSTSITTTTSATLFYTRKARTTSSSTGSPIKAQDLSIHFDGVKDTNETDPALGMGLSTATTLATTAQPEKDDLTEHEQVPIAETSGSQETILLNMGNSTATTESTLIRQSLSQNRQSKENARQQCSTSLALDHAGRSISSSSLPELHDEYFPVTGHQPILDRTTSNDESLEMHKSYCSTSAPSSPSNSKNDFLLHRAASAPITTDSDALSEFNKTSTHQTPQKLAEDFCQNLRIIEQVLAQSGTKIDPSRAVDLAMIHQTTQIKQQEQQQHFEYRYSEVKADRYDFYLQQLSTMRDECLQSVSGAITSSLLVCLFLEGGRHALNLIESLEYFSVKNFGDVMLQMACGCDNETMNYFSNPSQSSYISLASSMFLSVLTSGISDSTNNSLASLLQFTGYFSCLLCYFAIFLTMSMVHAVMRELHAPALVHQLVNVTVLVLYLAQNPRAWVIVTQNLSVYLNWMIFHAVMTLLSFCVVIALYIRTRNYFLLRQQQVADRSSKDAYALCANGKKTLARLEDLRWVVAIVPPLFMGALILITSGNR